uniref:Ig-like domain-containing protein n=2 Tax=Macrostomum lignano TaxID=282301 RepID=A0A1I8ISY9_9PLAT
CRELRNCRSLRCPGSSGLHPGGKQKLEQLPPLSRIRDCSAWLAGRLAGGMGWLRLLAAAPALCVLLPQTVLIVCGISLYNTWITPGSMGSLLEPNEDSQHRMAKVTGDMTGGQLLIPMSALLLSLRLPACCYADSMDAMITSTKKLKETIKEARITEGPETLRVLNRSRAQFYCKAEGSPAPEIQWLVNGKPVRNSARHLTYDMAFGKILRIESVDAVTDRNLLVSCVAKNAVSSTPAVANASLHVYSTPPAGFPRIVEAPKMQVTERSQRVRMGCYAQGARPMRYQWTRSEVRLDLSRPRLQLSNGSLIIEKVLPEDDGKYQCSVTNSVGTVYSEPAHLYVREDVVQILDWLMRYN